MKGTVDPTLPSLGSFAPISGGGGVGCHIVRTLKQACGDVRL